jgi:DNA-binding CsgD family transcriptional regulator
VPDFEWLSRVLGGPVETVGDRYDLTQRERDVLRLTASGLHTKAVASQLGCSAKTVEEYWHRMFRKITCGSREEIVTMVLVEALARRPPWPHSQGIS